MSSSSELYSGSSPTSSPTSSPSCGRSESSHLSLGVKSPPQNQLGLWDMDGVPHDKKNLKLVNYCGIFFNYVPPNSINSSGRELSAVQSVSALAWNEVINKRARRSIAAKDGYSTGGGQAEVGADQMADWVEAGVDQVTTVTDSASDTIPGIVASEVVDAGVNQAETDQVEAEAGDAEVGWLNVGVVNAEVDLANTEANQAAVETTGVDDPSINVGCGGGNTQKRALEVLDSDNDSDIVVCKKRKTTTIHLKIKTGQPSVKIQIEVGAGNA